MTPLTFPTNESLLARMLQEGDENPDQLFHVECLMKSGTNRLLVDINGFHLGRLSKAMMEGLDHPIELIDRSSRNGEARSVLVDPLELATLAVSHHHAKTGRQA